MIGENRRESVTVASLDAIPDFATETEERQFWATHRVGKEIYNQVPSGEDDDDHAIPLAEPPHWSARSRLRFDLE